MLQEIKNYKISRIEENPIKVFATNGIEEYELADDYIFTVGETIKGILVPFFENDISGNIIIKIKVVE
jgi:hypothetical protein